MKPGILLTLLALTLNSAFGEESQEQILLKKLIEQKYFKTATCEFNASYFLSRVGLPKIGPGSSNWVQNRGNVDRSHENSRPPILIDGLVYPDGNPRVEIKTETTDSQHWALILKRWTKGARLVTSRFEYALKPAHLMTSCILQQIEVSVESNSSAPPTKRRFKMNDCLTLTLNPENDPWNGSPALNSGYAEAVQDCTTGLQFFAPY